MAEHDALHNVTSLRKGTHKADVKDLFGELGDDDAISAYLKKYNNGTQGNDDKVMYMCVYMYVNVCIYTPCPCQKISSANWAMMTPYQHTSKNTIMKLTR